jgi:hypothetical protein
MVCALLCYVPFVFFFPFSAAFLSSIFWVFPPPFEAQSLLMRGEMVYNL